MSGGNQKKFWPNMLRRMIVGKVKIDGFNTFRNEDGLEELVTKVLVEMDKDTGNYFVELFGEDVDGEYTIDAEELINFKEVTNYLTYLGRDYEYMMGQLQKYNKEVA